MASGLSDKDELKCVTWKIDSIDEEVSSYRKSWKVPVKWAITECVWDIILNYIFLEEEQEKNIEMLCGVVLRLVQATNCYI
jgi:hypothetical protein